MGRAGRVGRAGCLRGRRGAANTLNLALRAFLKTGEIIQNFPRGSTRAAVS